MNSDTSWIEINTSILHSNIKQIKRVVGPNVLIAPCVKANAYGHGLVPTSKVFVSAGANWLSVATLEEALKLKSGGLKVPIQITSPLVGEQLKVAIESGFIIFLSSKDQLRSLKTKKAKAFVKVDTGMSRTGLLPKNLSTFLKELKKYKGIEVLGLSTHFATSDDPTSNLFIKQFSTFEKLVSKYKDEFKYFQCSNSSSTLSKIPKGCNIVRPGLASYGEYPSKYIEFVCGLHGVNLHSSLTFKAKIMQVKSIPKNSFVGYGASYKVKKRTKIAIVGVGYFDGYDRGLSNKGTVLVKKQVASVIGRVCMNHLIIDVTKIKNVKNGDEVVLTGRQGNKEVRVWDIAQKIDTIGYEVYARLREGLPRYYL